MLKLRDYQEEGISAVWAEINSTQTALAVKSTGLGKTEMLIGLIQKSITSYPELRCVFLVNKLKLLDQTARRLAHHLGPRVGEFHGKKKTLTHAVTVASIQSIHKIPLDINLLILDECHNVNQEDGRYLDFINQCRERNPKLKIVAVTATPFRSDGMIFGPNKMFSKICFERGLLWAQDEGYLVKVRLKHQRERFNTSALRIRAGEYRQEDVNALTADHAKMVRQLDNALPQLSDRTKVVWACSSIEHCEMIHTELILRGETATRIHSKMESEEAEDAISSFEDFGSKHLVFVTIVSEGYDYPPIDGVVLMRPTRSPVLYVQTIGRGLRPVYPEDVPLLTKEDRLTAIAASTKKDCLVLDYGGVIENCGPLHDPLVGRPARKGAAVEIAMKFCPTCLEYCELRASNCPACEHSFASARREVSLKNLTTTSYAGSITGEEEYKIDAINFSRHTAKSGNDCLKITYILANLFPRTIDEYLIPTMAFSFAIIKKRLDVLGIGTFNDATYSTSLHCKHRDLVILIKKEKGYWKVVDVRNGNSNTDS